MENKVTYKYGFIINYKFGRRHRINKEIQAITCKYGLIKEKHLTVICFNNLQEAISIKNLLLDITEVSETVYAIKIQNQKVVEFEEILKEIRHQPQEEVHK